MIGLKSPRVSSSNTLMDPVCLASFVCFPVCVPFRMTQLLCRPELRRTASGAGGT